MCDGRDRAKGRRRRDGQVRQAGHARGLALLTGDVGFSNILQFPLGTHSGIIVVRFPNELPASKVNQGVLEALSSVPEEDVRGNLLIIEDPAPTQGLDPTPRPGRQSPLSLHDCGGLQGTGGDSRGIENRDKATDSQELVTKAARHQQVRRTTRVQVPSLPPNLPTTPPTTVRQRRVEGPHKGFACCGL